MHRLFQLQHNRYSGKLLHHRHTSFRTLALLLALTGGALVWITIAASRTSSADQLFVNATVPAPVPTTGAVILEPKDGSQTNNAIITVSGTCPVITPAVVVAIYDNGVLGGSAPCLGDGTFQVELTLFLGKNVLVAKTVTITDGHGPDSAPVTVTYALRTPPIAPGGMPPPVPTNGGSSAAVGPIVINSDKSFVIFGPHQAAVWTGTITGGSPPYTVTLNWGDGTIVSLKNVATGRQVFRHKYTSLIAYVLHITAIDGHSGNAIASFAVMTPYVAPSLPATLGTSGGLDPYKYLALYSTYLALLGVFGITWLRSHPYAYARVPVPKRAPARNRQNRRRR